jgi:ubiquinone/menaquinone biosynthesis C-methylase UbiE
MSSAPDQAHLLANQYQNASHFNARLALHARFSVNRYGWNRWVFDQYELPAQAQVLELGCGPGTLWAKNRERIPAGWNILLSDFSGGMLEDARRNLAGVSHPFQFRQVDALAIPLPDGSLDAVIANHMLYHVPDRPRAFAEIRRVLKPDGKLYAATNGVDHLRELAELQARVGLPDLLAGTTAAFGLETGTVQLAPWFAQVVQRRYEDALHVTSAEPLIAYIESMYGAKGIDAARRATLTALIAGELARHGAIQLTKSTGLFIASRQPVAPPEFNGKILIGLIADHLTT